MNIVPKVVFEKMSLENNIDLIIDFSNDNNDDVFPMKKLIVDCFPELKDCFFKEDKDTIIKEVVTSYYNKQINKIEETVLLFQKEWEKYNDVFMIDLSKYLNISWPSVVTKIKAYVGIMPVCPRWLEDYSFAIYWWKDLHEISSTTSHECCHFLYFEKWKQLYPDYKKEDFESPSLIWKLSEMVTDPILNSKSIKNIFNYEHKGYSTFYTGVELKKMNKIKDIYNENSIEVAIVKSYDYLKTKED